MKKPNGWRLKGIQPHWILADAQSAGRGRRGRVWQSPKGNLMTTVYQPGRIETEKAGQLSFVAGLALADTVSSLIGGGRKPVYKMAE